MNIEIFKSELFFSVSVFTICSIINVMLNTVKTLVMYKKNIWSSSAINAITYGFYTIIVVLMAGEIPLIWKITMTAITNFIGVAASMKIMERFEKEKLWKVEATVLKNAASTIEKNLKALDLSFNYIDGVGEYIVFNIFCYSKEQSAAVREILKQYNVRYFVNESLTL